MRTLRVVLTVLILFVIWGTALAGGGVDPTTKFAYHIQAIKGTDKFRLAFENESKQKVSIRIMNEAGDIVFSEIQKEANKMNKTYDLSSLGKGKYLVKIRSGKFQVEEELMIGKIEEVAFIGKITNYSQKKNTFRVAFKASDEEVKLKITDQTGNVVYERSITGYHNYHALYNVNDLSVGNYKITLSTQDQTIKQTYTVTK